MMNIALITLGVILNSIAITEPYINNYNQVVLNLVAYKASCKNVADSTIKMASHRLYNTLKDSIFPAWYNTPWDFNGISNIPGEGEIACGYFVSTTLKHAGFNLNRYKLAQQGATAIATAICGKDKMKRIGSLEEVLAYAGEVQNGLFIVGLDYHVGFLVVENSEVYFVHSDYFNNKVIKEKALTSQGFGATNSYVIG
jgi:hypothetical protein